MKQFQFEYNEEKEFSEKLNDFRTWCNSNGISNMFFQIYSEVLDDRTISGVCGVIEKIFPETWYMGCSTSGNIVDCRVSSEIVAVCTVFENPSTKILVRQYELTQETVDAVTESILEESEKNPWVKAIELYFPILEGSTTRFCDRLKEIPPDVRIFGAVSCSMDITSSMCRVFSKGKEISPKSIVVVFYGGKDFFVDAIQVTGWKPLGRKFHVTKSDGCIIHELDGILAYDVYHKYLNIKNDENFFYNALEFPLFYEHNDTTILRAPVASNADGSITMSSDIDVGSIVRISYGDPGTIVESIKEDSEKIHQFQPDVLHIFSCAARKTFWNTTEPTYEIAPFKEIAPSCGFFSHGEFLRVKGNLNQHNVTLVIAAMREGEKRQEEVPAMKPGENSLSKLPLVSRLATFISVTSMELEEMNQKLEHMNEKLKEAAIIDGLTGLYNRKEIQTQIENELIRGEKRRFSLVMLDIDNFKQVNDTYGHQEGDTVIIALANILQNEKSLSPGRFSAGRWGGEEFMLLLHDTDVSTAAFIAELIRQCFANTSFPLVRSQTVSLGVTQTNGEDTLDSLCSRVDSALYKAKKTGKNKVVVI